MDVWTLHERKFFYFLPEKQKAQISCPPVKSQNLSLTKVKPHKSYSGKRSELGRGDWLTTFVSWEYSFIAHTGGSDRDDDEG